MPEWASPVVLQFWEKLIVKWRELKINTEICMAHISPEVNSYYAVLLLV